MKLFVAIKDEEYKVKRLFYIYCGFEQITSPNNTQFLAENPEPEDDDMLFFHYNHIDFTEDEVRNGLCKAGAQTSPLEIMTPQAVLNSGAINFIVKLEDFIQYYRSNAEVVVEAVGCDQV